MAVIKFKVKKVHILHNEKCHIYIYILHYYILNFFIPQSAESTSKNKRKTNAMATQEKPKVIRKSDKNDRSKTQA